jgi:hypothetical protein
MSHHRDLDKLIDDARESQRNIVFPDTVRNGRSVDSVLWKGSPNPTFLQKIGAWLFGLTFIGQGLAILLIARQFRNDDVSRIGVFLVVLVSLSVVLVGIRIFRNGFSRRQKSPDNSN